MTFFQMSRLIFILLISLIAYMERVRKKQLY